MLYSLVYRCFTLYSDRKKFQRELVTLKGTFQRNVYLTSFVGKCFKMFLRRLYIVKSTLATAEKKPLWLVLFCLGLISLEVINKIRML